MWRLLKIISQLSVISAVFLAVAAGSWLGYSWHLTPYVAVTAYGIVAFTRKAVQVLLAAAHNRTTQIQTRSPIISSIDELTPDQKLPLKKLLNKRLKFDDWREWLKTTLSERYNFEADEVGWEQIIQNSWAHSRPLSVGVVVPIYKTRLKELERLVTGLVNQTYKPDLVVLALNDKTDHKMEAFIHELIEKFQDSSIEFVYKLVPTPGKRHAMYEGFKLILDSNLDVAFNIDSDSEPDIDSISNAIRYLSIHPNIQCMTGDIRVENKHDNLLTKLTYQRYFIAFNIERAAQAFFDAVTCLSGPFLAVRRQTLELIIEEWHNQTFFGKECTYGDDRHISTSTLALNFIRNSYSLLMEFGIDWIGSGFSPECISYTDVPNQIRVWIIQQLRWSRSFWRETLISLRWLFKLPGWVVFDIVYQTLFPFILIVILGSISRRTWIIFSESGLDPALTSVLPYIIVVVSLITLFHGIYGSMSNRDWRYMYNPIYLFHHFFILIPIRFYALSTLYNTGWGTK